MYHERLANEASHRTAEIILTAFEPLPPEQRQQVLDWLAQAAHVGIQQYARGLEGVLRNQFPLHYRTLTRGPRNGTGRGG
jgi:hypothetical protein